MRRVAFLKGSRSDAFAGVFPVQLEGLTEQHFCRWLSPLSTRSSPVAGYACTGRGRGRRRRVRAARLHALSDDMPVVLAGDFNLGDSLPDAMRPDFRPEWTKCLGFSVTRCLRRGRETDSPCLSAGIKFYSQVSFS